MYTYYDQELLTKNGTNSLITLYTIIFFFASGSTIRLRGTRRWVAVLCAGFSKLLLPMLKKLKLLTQASLPWLPKMIGKWELPFVPSVPTASRAIHMSQ